MAKDDVFVEVELSETLVEEVILDWEQEHPGQTSAAMTSEDFAARMMDKMAERATVSRVQ